MRINDQTTATVTYPYGTSPSVYRARANIERMIPEWQIVHGAHPLHLGGVSHIAIGSVGAYLSDLPDSSSEIL
jgi:hypothetical protein